MDDNYAVQGIVQSLVNGQWYERAILTRVYAVDQEHAAEQVLRLCTTIAQQDDAHALVRWHEPKMVRVWSIC